MMSVNKVFLMGYLGQDPNIVSFRSGGRAANLRLATSRRWKDRNTGESREATQWHSVTLFVEQHVSLAEQVLRKGSRVYIEGELEYQKWTDKNGQERESTVVAVRPYSGSFSLLDKREDRPSGGSRSSGPAGGPPSDLYDRPASNRSGQGYGQGYGQRRGGMSSSPPPFDDEVPF